MSGNFPFTIDDGVCTTTGNTQHVSDVEAWDTSNFGKPWTAVARDTVKRHIKEVSMDRHGKLLKLTVEMDKTPADIAVSLYRSTRAILYRIIIEIMDRPIHSREWDDFELVVNVKNKRVSAKGITSPEQARRVMTVMDLNREISALQVPNLRAFKEAMYGSFETPGCTPAVGGIVQQHLRADRMTEAARPSHVGHETHLIINVTPPSYEELHRALSTKPETLNRLLAETFKQESMMDTLLNGKKSFLIVFGVNTNVPAPIFEDSPEGLEEAQERADLLASQNDGKRFFVMRSISTHAIEKPVVRREFINSAEPTKPASKARAKKSE